MRGEVNGGKQGVIAAWVIGGLSIALMLLNYFEPPDPTHPIGLGFFSRRIAVPVWLVFLFLALAVCIALIAHYVSPSLSLKTSGEKSNKHLATSEAIQSSALPTAASSKLKPDGFQVGEEKAADKLTVPGISTATEGSQEIILTTTYQVDIYVKVVDSTIVLRVDNNRLGGIHYLDIILQSAFSFDNRHNGWRTHPATGGVRLQAQDFVGPSDSSRNFLLVHCSTTKDQLLLGNDNTRPMGWPPLDRAIVQRWKVSVSVGARAYSNTIPATGEVFAPMKFDLFVSWQKATNKFTLEEGEAPIN